MIETMMSSARPLAEHPAPRQSDQEKTVGEDENGPGAFLRRRERRIAPEDLRERLLHELESGSPPSAIHGRR